MALQLERAMGRRVMIQRFPITMILFYCIKTSTQLFRTPTPMLAPSTPAPHWPARLCCIPKAPVPLPVPTFAAFDSLGFFLSRSGEGRGGPGEQLSYTLIEAGWHRSTEYRWKCSLPVLILFFHTQERMLAQSSTLCSRKATR